MQITLTQQNVGLPADLHLSSVFGIEENPIAWFDSTDVLPHGHHLCPGEPSTHLCGSRDDDAR